jgi:surfeit locus 1 family protein
MSLQVGGFRLGLAPTLITLPLVLLCLGLGVWQIQRLHWKEGLIAARAAAAAAPPVAPPATLDQARRLELHRIVDRGAFLNDKEILVHAIAGDGAAGFDVLTPLQESGGRRIIFVDRGFVPTGLKSRTTREAGEPVGTVKIAGRLLLPISRGLFVPDNRPESGEWFSIDLAAMAKADGIGNVAPFYIAADATPNPGGWPKGGEALPELPNHHLQYAITWLSLAAIGLYIYFKSQRQPAEGQDERLRKT